MTAQELFKQIQQGFGWIDERELERICHQENLDPGEIIKLTSLLHQHDMFGTGVKEGRTSSLVGMVREMEKGKGHSPESYQQKLLDQMVEHVTSEMYDGYGDRGEFSEKNLEFQEDVDEEGVEIYCYTLEIDWLQVDDSRQMRSSGDRDLPPSLHGPRPAIRVGKAWYKSYDEEGMELDKSDATADVENELKWALDD